MPKIDDLLKTGAPLGIAIGVGATVLAAAIIPAIPAVMRVARPSARAALKSGLVLIERGREIMSEVNEEFEDMLAEVRAELQQERNTEDSGIGDAFEDAPAEVRDEFQQEGGDAVATARKTQS